MISKYQSQSRARILVVSQEFAQTRSRISISLSKQVQSRAKIVRISKVRLVSPPDQSEQISPVEFKWKIPSSADNKNIHCHIQIATDENFSSIEVEKKTYKDSGFQYWNGSSWVDYPTNGVSSEFYGNEARIIIPLSLGTKYWRVRGAIIE